MQNNTYQTYNFEATSKKERFLNPGNEISISTYNLFIGVYIAMGFFLNFLTADKMPNLIMQIPLPAIIVIYFVGAFLSMFLGDKAGILGLLRPR